MSPQRLKQKELEEARTEQLSLKVGSLIDNRWQLCDSLGAGGNGSVWKCIDVKDGREYAIKILKYNNKKALQRFSDEIHIMKDVKPDGVLPIHFSKPIDMNRIEEKCLYYYVMPLAKTVGQMGLLNQPVATKVQVILHLFDVLRSLHDNKIAHRDIKLDNILFYENQYVFADFGLVTYEGKTQITRNREALGGLNAFDPRSSITRHLSEKDMQKIDVCEFAKVIWTMLTGQERITIFGQYRNDGPYALTAYMGWEKLAFGELDDLLMNCTEIEGPLRNRPNIKEMCQRFKKWWAKNQDETTKCQGRWQDMICTLRHKTSANVYTWSEQYSINKIIRLLSQYVDCFIVQDQEGLSKDFNEIPKENISTLSLYVGADILDSVIYVKYQSKGMLNIKCIYTTSKNQTTNNIN